MGKEKAIYAPGELGKVRGRLGDVDREEAQRMAKILGGEVGVERDEEEAARNASSAKARAAKSGGGSRPASKPMSKPASKSGSKSGSKPSKAPKPPRRRIEVMSEESSVLKKPVDIKAGDSGDDPSKPLVQNYSERLKMDRLASQPTFDIKTLSQTMKSMFSFFTRPEDFVAPFFVNKRMNEYYKVIETLVVSTRTLFPRNNAKRNDQMKQLSLFAYSVLDVIRYWNIERIAGDMAKMQSRSRNVKVKDFTGILQAIYKPLFILEALVPEIHIKGCYKLLYKQLFIENPLEASKYQEVVKNTLAAFIVVRKDIRIRMYPLLMKLVSDKCLPCEIFFRQRRKRIMAFIKFEESERIAPVDMLAAAKRAFKSDPVEEEPVAIEENKPDEDAKKQAVMAERSAVERGLNHLEIMFPEAGWNSLPDYPDLYPYFRGILQMIKGYELIAPTDPVHQLVILARIIEELLIGLRSVTFTVLADEEASENQTYLAEEMTAIINNWHDYVAESLDKEYVSRLSEYCQALVEAADVRKSSFGRRLVDEMCFAKRLYFFPHLHYTAQSATTMSTFQKKDIPSLFREVRKLRRNLTIVYGEIEKGMKAGGPEANALCEGIADPWKPYVFQVAGPISKRLDVLLGQKKRHNASLILFTLSVTIVLDYFLNNVDSWAYNPPKDSLFRSIDGLGVVPQFGVDEKIDAEAIFKEKLKERMTQKP